MLEPVAAGLALLALGVAIGRRIGLAQGERLGRARAPLALRIRALESDRCPVCGQEVGGSGRNLPIEASARPPFPRPLHEGLAGGSGMAFSDPSPRRNPDAAPAAAGAPSGRAPLRDAAPRVRRVATIRRAGAGDPSAGAAPPGGGTRGSRRRG